MIKNREDKSGQNFWISYADLMAGLLFVFILLIGAIVVKYLFLQGDLLTLKTNLESQEKSLKISEEELAKKRKKVASVTTRLIAANEKIGELSAMQIELEKKLKNSNKERNVTQDSLDAARVLLSKKAQELNTTAITLDLRKNEILKLKSILLETETSLNNETNKTATLTKKLEKNSHLMQAQEENLTLLSKQLLAQTATHQKLIEDLNITKLKIKNLTGIRIKVIKILKKKLGNSIGVDPNSGAIRLSSSVLFDKDSAVLKKGAKKALQKILTKYIKILLNDKNMRKNIDKIVIEGYTDSDGPYLYNLKLSQKRALAVLEFIYSLKHIDTKILQKYVSSSGRSFSNLIMKNGKEDQDASRRIEVKFTLSNKKSIEEIEKFLQGNYD